MKTNEDRLKELRLILSKYEKAEGFEKYEYVEDFFNLWACCVRPSFIENNEEMLNLSIMMSEAFITKVEEELKDKEFKYVIKLVDNKLKVVEEEDSYYFDIKFDDKKKATEALKNYKKEIKNVNKRLKNGWKIKTSLDKKIIYRRMKIENKECDIYFYIENQLIENNITNNFKTLPLVLSRVEYAESHRTKEICEIGWSFPNDWETLIAFSEVKDESDYFKLTRNEEDL